MNQRALRALLEAVESEEPGEFGGRRSPSRWARSVAGHAYTGLLMNMREPMGREELMQFCGEEVSAVDRVLAVSAWGGMRVYRGRELFAARSLWNEHITELFQNGPPRVDAYKAFAELRRGNALPGMGPAFYTKLIFFLSGDPRGYIMDQWTARSINLLFDNQGVNLVGGKFVSDANTADMYEAFCQRIEHLAGVLSQEIGRPFDAEAVELAIFSRGGRRSGPWRDYVKRNG